MAIKVDAYFGGVDFEYLIGDQFNEAFQYEVDGSNFSFTNYTVTGQIVDKFGTTVATLTATKSTQTVTDDTITLKANPSALPTESGVYGYWVTYTSDLDANEVRTWVRGKVVFKPKTEF